MGNQRVLDVWDMHKSYDGIEVLKGISFSLDRGQTKVLIGPSGSGKRTLLNCINYLVEHDRGEIKLNGTRVEEGNLNAMRARMGLVLQGFKLFAHLIVLDNIRICPIQVKKVNKNKATTRGKQKMTRDGMAQRAKTAQ